MKHRYAALWWLLAASFAAVAILSASSPVRIGSYELKDSGLASFLSSPAENRPVARVGDAESAASPQPTPAVKAAPVDTSAQVILFIGDSMLEGLSPRLAAYAKQNGHKLYSVIWYSSTSRSWGRSDRLAGYIRRIKPDFVFICLGANELFVSKIESTRDKFVKKIITDLGDIPYLWIGPPNWKADTGINRLIEANAGEGEYFRSAGMTFERGKDGAHPTRQSASEWMDSVIRWMPAHSPHPFRLVVPAKPTDSPTRVYVHQPSE